MLPPMAGHLRARTTDLGRRRLLIAGLAAAASRRAEAQPPSKPARIGLLVIARNPLIESAFPEGLAQLGYESGRDVVVEWRSADGHTDRLPRLAVELVRLRVDIIVAAGPEARIASMKATSTTPIVAIGGSDPVAEGWARSIARPGGVVTGLTVTFPELLAKKIELVKQMIPGLTRLAVLVDPSADPMTLSGQVRETWQAKATALAIDVGLFEVRRLDDLGAAIQRMVQDRRQGLVVVETAMLFAHRAEIAERALRRRLPAIGEWRASVADGFLASYGADLAELLRRAAGYVDRIVKGSKLGELPIERPTKFQLVVNQTTARALGITIPPAVLLRVDEVIG